MTNHKCSDCNKKFKSKNDLGQHIIAKHLEEAKPRIKTKYYILAVILIVIIGAAIIIVNQPDIPGEYDDFAKCLTENNAIMYGTNWCTFCKQQKATFGKSFEYINYVNCDFDSKICNNAGVTSYPQWDVNGERLKGAQSLELLSSLSGCSLQKQLV